MSKLGFPGDSDGKETALNAGDPGSGKSSGEGNSCPLQNSCLENAMDRGPWRATVHGVAKSQTTFFPLPVQIQGHFHAQDGPPTPVGAERPLGAAGTGMCVPVSAQGPLLWFISDSGRGGEPPCVTVCGWGSRVGWGQVCLANSR